jgi:hypothetical protein
MFSTSSPTYPASVSVVASAMVKRLAHAGGPQQEDVRLLQLDVVIPERVRVDALVVAVDRDREEPLGPLLSHDVLVEDFLDLGRGGDLGDRLGDLPLLVLRQDLVAERNALVADVHGRPGDELPDGVLGLSAERTAQVLVAGHLSLRSPRRMCL